MSVTGQHDQAVSDTRGRLHALHFSTDGLSSMLEQITVLAADTVDADTGVGLTLIREGHPTTVAASDERTQQLDEVQYNNGDGPCLTCARTGELVTVDDVRTDDRWPAYHARAATMGLRKSYSMPLSLPDPTVGALNVYQFDGHRLDDDERAMLSEFCDEASRVVSLGMRHERLRQENNDLHSAMGTRRVIDQAIGIVMAQNRCAADEAFDVLRRASMNRNVRISLLAAEMIRTLTGIEPDRDPRFRR
jgi:GAF domain-containing protein